MAARGSASTRHEKNCTAHTQIAPPRSETIGKGAATQITHADESQRSTTNAHDTHTPHTHILHPHCNQPCHVTCTGSLLPPLEYSAQAGDSARTRREPNRLRREHRTPSTICPPRTRARTPPVESPVVWGGPSCVWCCAPAAAMLLLLLGVLGPYSRPRGPQASKASPVPPQGHLKAGWGGAPGRGAPPFCGEPGPCPLRHRAHRTHWRICVRPARQPQVRRGKS